MSEHAAEHPHINYTKIYIILVILLGISVLGPMLEIEVVTLITAFGIALVKAYLVAKNFMHVNRVPKFIPYVMVTSLVFMLLFFSGVAPDVMQDEGDNWKKNLDTWHYSPAPTHQAAAGHGEGGH